MISLTNVKKSYHQGSTVVEVLKDIDLHIAPGERVAIVGASGSGKSTLLSIMAGMEVADSGTVVVNGKNIATLGEKGLSEFRNHDVAVIFQSFELVPAFTAHENVLLPLDVRNVRGADGHRRAEEALKAVGLSHRVNHLPTELSGGEEQRVAIARALAQDPVVLFADEPTGNLDRKTGDIIMEQLLNASAGGAGSAGAGDGARASGRRTLVMITHDEHLAQRMDRILLLENGRLTEQKK
jgi:putative ABC transport system ATP-binding protein